MNEYVYVTYRLHCQPGESASEKARDIGLEQTVELPHTLIERTGWGDYAGRVEALSEIGQGVYSACIAYPVEVMGGEITQLLNVLFGNISLKDGIEVADLQWPATLLETFGGPAHGIAGLRAHCGVAQRPLLCAALKPMGLSVAAFASLCRELALGGVDIIKDDHGLADQSIAPFAERVAACQQAVADAGAQSGRQVLYFPNVTAPRDSLAERLDIAAEAGCPGVLLSPMLTGMDAIGWIRDNYRLMVMAHPSLTGSFFQPGHGIHPALLLGELFRIAGADAAIYPNVGGRFGFSQSTCEAINARLRRPLGTLAPAMPTVGGGISPDTIGHWSQQYGSDTMFLIGGGLYAQPDLRQAARSLISELESRND